MGAVWNTEHPHSTPPATPAADTIRPPRPCPSVLIALTFTDGTYWTEVVYGPVKALMWALQRIQRGDVRSCRVGGHDLVPFRLPPLCGVWS